MWQIFYSLHEIDFCFYYPIQSVKHQNSLLVRKFIKLKKYKPGIWKWLLKCYFSIHTHNWILFRLFLTLCFWLNPHQESWSLRWSCTIHPFCYHQPFTALRTCRSKVVKQWCKRTNRKDITSFLLIFCQ